MAVARSKLSLQAVGRNYSEDSGQVQEVNYQEGSGATQDREANANTEPEIRGGHPTSKSPKARGQQGLPLWFIG